MNFTGIKLQSKFVSMVVHEGKLFVATEETFYELQEFNGYKILVPIVISGGETMTFTTTFSGVRHD